jgi:hypothetical protein
MIAPDSGKVSITDIAYRDGYRDGEQDVLKRLSAILWDKELQMSKAFPQIALGIREAIEEIQELSNY